MTARGCKGVQEQDLPASAGTASRAAQRLLTSEAVLKGRDINADAPKTHLEEVSHAELAAQTGRPFREVCSTATPATADELRNIRA